MSENTVTISETENTEVSENVETVETDNNVETVEVPEVSAADKAAEAIAALDDTDPLKAMVNAFRSALTEKGAAIDVLVKEVKAGGEEIDERIAELIADSTDTETVKARELIEKMRAALDKSVSELNAKIAAENDLTPMTPEVKEAKTAQISEMRQKYNAVKSASEKALKNMLPDEANAAVFFADLSAPGSVSGGTGTGAKKPRLSGEVYVTFKDVKEQIAPAAGNDFPTFGDVAEYVSKKSGLTNAKDRIRPTDISAKAIAEGLENGVVDFEFTTSEGANVFLIHAETRG
jgi:hypothetical protein